MGRRCVLIAAALVTALASAAAADPLTPFHGPSGEVTVTDVRPHVDAPEARGNRFYSEWWAVIFYLDGGYEAYVRFLATNMGLDSGSVVVTAELKLPDDQSFSEQTDLKRDQWDPGPADRLAVKFGDNSLSGPIDNLVIHVKNDSFEADFHLKNLVAPWKPGNGRAQYGSSPSRYFAVEIPAPVAAVEGTVKVVGETETRKIRGIATAEHQLMTVGMHEQAKRWLRFRAIGRETTFIAADIETPDVYGNAHVQYAVLFSGAKKVFDTTSFTATLRDMVPDQVKPEYVAAHAVKLQWHDGADRYVAALKVIKQTGRQDYVASAGALERFVVSKFARPMLYDYDARFAIEATVGGHAEKFGGTGRYFFTVVNP